jgi:hypothetical protein
LRRICANALSECEALTSIAIPASVEVIEEYACKRCGLLGSVQMAENAVLVEIGNGAFAECCSLRSLDLPRNVERIGRRCFKKCFPLNRLRFGSSESLNKVVGDGTFDEALEIVGLGVRSGEFKIEVNHVGDALEFPGWTSVYDRDSNLKVFREI